MLNVCKGIDKDVRECLGMSHMEFMSLMRSLSSFLMFGT